MRFNEFKTISSLLSEVSMKPGALASSASAIDATCGIEFEIYVPAQSSNSSDDEPDNDYREDPWAYTIDNVVEFYDESAESQNLRSTLDTEYQEWIDNALGRDWDSSEEERIADYIMDSEYDLDEKMPEAYEALGFTEAEIKSAEEYRSQPTSKSTHLDSEGAKELVNNALAYIRELAEEDAAEEARRMGRIYETVREEFYDSAYAENDYSEERFFRANGLVRMSHFEDAYDLRWPNKNEPDLETELASIADEIERITGYDATYTESYHGAEHYKGKMYVIEPDSSLDSPDSGYIGVEIVSPAIPYSDMIEQLSVIQNWARDKGCQATSETGLHMNVSLDNIPMQQLDYVKLALLVGDEHVLNQFSRIANTYCSSTLKTLGQKIKLNSDAARKVLDSLKQDLSSSASQIIFPGNSDKMVSLNRKANRLEFRGPGDDWINTDLSTLQNTLSRFVTAMNIASDPSAYQKEYAKKLYKIIDKNYLSSDAAAAFSYYASGTADVETLKQKLFSKKEVGNAPQAPYGDVKASNHRWFVSIPGETQEVLVTSPTKVGAVQQARKVLNLNSRLYPDHLFSVVPDIQRDIFGDRPPMYSSPEPEDQERPMHSIKQRAVPLDVPNNDSNSMLQQTPGSTSFRDAFGAISSSFPRNL